MPHHPPASPASPAGPTAISVKKDWALNTGKPLHNSPPSITAAAGALVGQTLTANPGSWTGKTPLTFTYQWTRDGTNISGATAQTYTLVAADKTHVISCQVTATNSTGAATAASKNSNLPAN